ncbi:alpha-12-mannosyltransferase alg9 [Anaeramoeba ignava]|uniref:Mannosyltransferase n=1 Tax=Anaeramoeba ignava TaxID=1746090 RepID=A0A9Q0LJX6_ANAIG|nr:alpha-12-mannosyltransferase alg9 [Anaeramoeba ignava]
MNNNFSVLISFLTSIPFSLFLLLTSFLVYSVFDFPVDSNEVYNNLEPIHSLIYGFGFQQNTNYTQNFFHCILSLIAIPFAKLSVNKITIFFILRSSMACFSAFSLGYFVSGVKRVFGNFPTFFFILFLSFNTAIAKASRSIVPGSFLMISSSLIFGAFLNQNESLFVFSLLFFSFSGQKILLLFWIPYCIHLAGKKFFSFIKIFLFSFLFWFGFFVLFGFFVSFLTKQSFFQSLNNLWFATHRFEKMALVLKKEGIWNFLWDFHIHLFFSFLGILFVFQKLKSNKNFFFINLVSPLIFFLNPFGFGVDFEYVSYPYLLLSSSIGISSFFGLNNIFGNQTERNEVFEFQQQKLDHLIQNQEENKIQQNISNKEIVPQKHKLIKENLKRLKELRKPEKDQHQNKKFIILISILIFFILLFFFLRIFSLHFKTGCATRTWANLADLESENDPKKNDKKKNFCILKDWKYFPSSFFVPKKNFKIKMLLNPKSGKKEDQPFLNSKYGLLKEKSHFEKLDAFCDILDCDFIFLHINKKENMVDFDSIIRFDNWKIFEHKKCIRENLNPLLSLFSWLNQKYYSEHWVILKEIQKNKTFLERIKSIFDFF